MKKRRMILIGLIVIVLLIIIAPKRQIEGTNIWRKDDAPLVIAHAGGKLYYPGNTMRAFRNSIEVGVDVLEMDVHLTLDNILVTRHGENNTGNIRKMSNCDTVIWNETYQYLYENCNFGFHFELPNGTTPYKDLTHEEWVEAEVYLLKLEELFMTYGDDTLYVIEIKADADAPRTEAADELVRLIKEYELEEEVLVATSFEDISLYIRDEYPDIMISASHAKAQESIIKSYTMTNTFLNPDGYYALQIPVSNSAPIIGELDLDTAFLVSKIQSHNIAVHYWTINDEEVMEYLISIGADGIITDDPELLMDVINR